MSISALNWALKQPIKPSSLKFILVVLANYANEDGECWSSTERMMHHTSMNRKTIIAHMAELERRSLVVDTGKRTGKTNGIKVYRVEHPEISMADKTIPKTVHFKQSQKRMEAVPKLPLLSSPKNGHSPTPPNIEEHNYKHNLSIGKKIGLLEWEKHHGGFLRIEMMMHWVKENNLDPALVKPLIIEFRDDMLANANQYSDFTATFKNYMRRGFLSKTLAQVRLPVKTDAPAKFETYDRGMPI